MIIGLLVAWLLFGVGDPSWINEAGWAPKGSAVTDEVSAMDGGDPIPPKP